jgi:ribosome-associated translation inhibitor RaiA
MEEIQIIGIDEIGDEDKDIVNKLANEYYEKLKRAIKNEISVRIHIKEHSKAGKRHKSDIRVQLIAPTRRFDAQESDWDLARTLHKVFENIERQLQHKL